jgi:hypothetical protein
VNRDVARTTLVLPKDLLRRAKVKSALTDKSLSELVSEALEQTLDDPRGLTEEDLAWMRLAETSFDFWDNADDALYDSL